MGAGPRISVIGTSGAGKTTFSALAALRLLIPHIELDALYHGPDWTPAPDEDFRRQVAGLAAQERWVIDGNYGLVRDIVWQRATAVVWIDPPLVVIMAQVVWRSFSRGITGKELWNGNRERFRAWIDADHPIRWAFATHSRRQRDFLAAMKPHWIRLRNRKAMNAWLMNLTPAETIRSPGRLCTGSTDSSSGESEGPTIKGHARRALINM